MICSNLFNLTGFACHPIDGQGSLAQIVTPFCFADGDPLPVYVEKFSNNVHRFFDDGLILLHFLGRGMKFESGHKLRFLSNIATKHGANLSQDGILELISKSDEPADAFARYIACLISITTWEEEHQGVDADGSAFATMVAHALMQKYPGQDFKQKPSYLGSSGKRHELDFKIDGAGYIAVKPAPQSAAPALYKLVDITNRESNALERLAVVVDDRFDKEAAKSTQQVFRGIANTVIAYSKIAPQEEMSLH